MRVLIGADHRGYDLGQMIYQKIKDEGDTVNLIGLGKKSDDYVDIAYRVAQEVRKDPKNTKGILLCGSGAGVDMVANKVSGVRCALVFDKDRAIQAREHENANMIAIPADVLESDQAGEIVDAFLKTPFSNQDRHKRRLKKIEVMEKTGHPLLIIPGILSDNSEDFSNKLDDIRKAQYTFDWVQIDYMDNIFVQNKSIYPEQVPNMNDFEVEAQLMVAYPSEWYKRVVQAGAKRVVFPVESHEEAGHVLEQIRSLDLSLEVGLSLNPETSIEEIIPFLDLVDLVLLMSVHPGFSGQGFLPETVVKVQELRKESASVVIGVDGGITPAVAKQLVDAGVNNLVISSHLLEGDIDENLEKIWQTIED